LQLFCFLLLNITPKAFVPGEDTGARLFLTYPCLLNSLENTEKTLLEIEKVKDIPEIKAILRISGRSLISGTGSNYGWLSLN
jgi:HAE1 family hydrophobic/amphiphilic exporter-1